MFFEFRFSLCFPSGRKNRLFLWWQIGFLMQNCIFWLPDMSRIPQIPKTNKNIDFSNYAFPDFSLLDTKIGYFWPQIRILREISYPEPAGKLENPASRPNNVKYYVLTCFFFTASWG